MYLHLNQGRWYPWKRIAKYDAFLKTWSVLRKVITAPIWNCRVKLIFWNNSGFFLLSASGSLIQGSRKSQKFKFKKSKLSAGSKPLINLLVQNIFLQPKLIIRVLTNWSQSFNGISGFLGFEGWVPWKPCLDVFLLRIYFQNLQIASKMRDADSHHHAPVIAKETSFFFVR